MSSLITQRYAKALFEVSFESKKDETVYQDLKYINQLIDQSSDLKLFLDDPTISSSKRRNLIEEIFHKNTNALTYQFICLLEHKDRLNLLRDTYFAFESLYLESKKISKVTITSGVKLNDHQLKEINKHLKARFNKDIEPHVNIDATMLGGIKIQKGDIIYDYSLRTQLEDFKKNIINA